MQIGPRPAYENERPYSPGFQTIRPCVTGIFGEELPYSSTWSVIQQDTPDTQYLNPATLEAYSNTNAAYEGSSGSKKTIIIFSRATDSSKKYKFCPCANQVYGVGITARINAIGVDGNISIAQWIMRVRPITASYAYAQTWNSFIAVPPTMGTEILIIDQMNFGGSFQPDNVDFQYCSLSDIELPVGTPYYGVVIDVRCVIAQSAGAALTSQFASLAAGVWNSSKIYGIKV